MNQNNLYPSSKGFIKVFQNKNVCKIYFRKLADGYDLFLLIDLVNFIALIVNL